jgi:hypothetical protein
MTTTTTYISNDDLYNQFPAAHQFVLDNNQDWINESNYPKIEGWNVEMGENGPVAFHSLRWVDGSETDLSKEVEITYSWLQDDDEEDQAE